VGRVVVLSWYVFGPPPVGVGGLGAVVVVSVPGYDHSIPPTVGGVAGGGHFGRGAHSLSCVVARRVGRSLWLWSPLVGISSVASPRPVSLSVYSVGRPRVCCRVPSVPPFPVGCASDHRLTAFPVGLLSSAVVLSSCALPGVVCRFVLIACVRLLLWSLAQFPVVPVLFPLSVGRAFQGLSCLPRVKPDTVA